MELELTGVAAHLRVLGGAPGEERDDLAQRGVGDAIAHGRALRVEPDDPLAHGVDVGPVRLAPTDLYLERRLVGEQQLDTRGVVDRAANPLGVRAELFEPVEQVVVGVSAVLALGDRGVELGEPRVELQGRQCRWVADPVEEIPVVVEELGDPAQVLELPARPEQHEHRGLERGIVEEIVAGAAPARRT